MRNPINFPRYSIGLSLVLFLLSSFALVPALPVKKTVPTTKKQRIKQRTQQRLLHLERRAQHRRQKLQPRIQEGPSKNWTWAITGFSISGLAFILCLTLLLGGINSLGGAIIGIVVSIILGILGAIFSIVGLVMPGVDEKFGGRGLAIAGLALAGVTLLLLLIAYTIGTP